jgi:anti-sigma B factor antagonist
MQGIKISVNYVGARLDIVLITILGYVDTTTCQELAKVIQDLVRQKRYQIVADLGGVTYISSAGWGVFMGEIKNVRDKGGDLKIAQMTPEVFEVFEMLEFNRILNYYDSVEESIDEFDIVRGIDLTRVDEGSKKRTKNQAANLQNLKSSVAAEEQDQKLGAHSTNPSIPLKDFPLMEKVKRIVIENPFWGVRWICRQLNTEKYGSVRIGWFRMRSILKKLNLETKEKRYRFYRSR